VPRRAASRKTVRIIAGQQRGDGVEVVLEAGDEHGPWMIASVRLFGNLGFAAAGNCARLVAQRAFGMGADEAPRAAAARLFQVHFEADG